MKREIAAAAVAASSLAAVLPVFNAAPAAAASSPPLGALWASNGSATLSRGSGGGVGLPSGAHDAAWSPDGSRVAYIDPHGQLVTVRADGSGLVVLDSSGRLTRPTWADGGRVVVSESGGHLVMTPSAGGATTPIPGLNDPALTDSAPTGGPGRLLVFQRVRSDSSGPFAFVASYDFGTQKVTNASGTLGQFTAQADLLDPAMSPNGTTLAFMCLHTFPAQGGNPSVTRQVVCLSNLDGSGLRTLINWGNSVPVADATYPQWSPDGAWISYSGTDQHGNAGGSAVIDVAAGDFAADQPRFQPGSRGVWQPQQPTKTVLRLDGVDRVATAIQASRWAWTNAGTAPGNRRTASTAVLSRADLPADALAGSALAARAGGPLLLTSSGGLDPRVVAELHRTLAPGSVVYLLGGPAALSPAVASELSAAGFAPARVQGADRFGTAAAVADKVTSLSSGPAEVLLATGENFPDALAAGAAASSRPGTVVLLTADTTMPAATSTWLGRHPGSTLFAVGGAAVKAAAGRGAVPLFGADRYATAAAVARQFFPGPSRVGLATGLTWADALSGGSMIGGAGGPLLLSDPAGLSPEAASYLSQHSPTTGEVIAFGGVAALSPAVLTGAGVAVEGPGGVFADENDPNAH